MPSYPTRSLRFLDKLEAETAGKGHHAEPGPQARVALDIIVAGAGLGGLSVAVALARKGHKVRVYEQTVTLAEVGAGIQIPSNSSRLLHKWGLEPFLKDKVVEPETITFRRWENGTPVGLTRLVPDFRRSFDAPYWVVHRAHFHQALRDLARSLGVELHLSSRVKSYDPTTPSLTLENGAVHTADLIVGADGLKSLARKSILSNTKETPPVSGYAAYRATVSVDQIAADPDLSWLTSRPNLNVWIGDNRHVMTYMISGGEKFNMVLSHPETTEPHTWNKDTTLQDMRSHFEGWDPALLKLMSLIDFTLKWPLLSASPLNRWVHEDAKMLIMGDAAHAMVPYMSQGAAMAVEDAAAFAAVLEQISDRSELPRALSVFEKVRKLRTSQMQEASLINAKLWHFADGPEQRARDAAMAPEVQGIHFIESPNQWSDPQTQIWCYGYDAEEEVLKGWRAEN
ncbi:FAD/NAD(P)-binding domain-containing protein [Didymella exigua CBS 183.55]|uniref:FAD/NAD(P)-binding domain-containing protein n=1 Tax=Didymella exigua CBS 183.55 TaxID=1150837 RepID=A0A6A5R5C4_9PLEO|nr:FAD/NAD(P)-binding domain-containing protein [Didymella exigua CBS 183.55]KAF1922892.1 FAD/NAD(P)-binding domain-containing protein [Didymella exigua CBS 183.55]